MATLEEVLAKLDDDGKATVTAAIEAEKSRGIAESKKRNAENVSLRSRLDTIVTGLELDTTADLAEQIDALKAKIAAKSGKPASDPALAQMQRQLKEVTEKLTAKEKREADLVRSTAIEKASSHLSGKVHAHSEVAYRLFHEGKIGVNANGEVVYLGTDGVEADLSKGLDEYIKSRPDIAISQQKPGGGSQPATGAGTKTMSVAAFDQLSPIARAKAMAEGYALTD